MREGARPADPVFVGGSGSSGSSLAAKLIARHSRYAAIPGEIGFHACSKSGLTSLPALLEGEASLDEFLEDMREGWYRRDTEIGPRGLHRHFDRSEYNELLIEFENEFQGDPNGASERLLRSMLDPIAKRKQKQSWVEQTPRNVHAAPLLLSIHADAKIVHVLRDGRDVAATSLKRGRVESLASGIAVWRWHLDMTRRAYANAPADRILTVRFEELVGRDRSRSYSRLLEFLSVSDEPAIKRWFEQQISPEKAEIDAWRKGLSEGEQARVTGLYEEALASVGNLEWI